MSSVSVTQMEDWINRFFSYSKTLAARDAVVQALDIEIAQLQEQRNAEMAKHSLLKLDVMALRDRLAEHEIDV